MSDGLQKETALKDWLRANGSQDRMVNDIVFNSIKLNGILWSMVDTVQFQRLRFIKQLGVSYLVYPSSDFSRFEHSLGVCHLAGRVVKNLREKLEEVPLDGVGITAVDTLCVQIAALCHDIGHGPFSHLFDGNFLQSVRVREDGKKWCHEELSIKMFYHLLEKNPKVKETLDKYLVERDYVFIEELILGQGKNTSNEDDWEFCGRDATKGFLYDIVSNKRDGFDVDRFDYFLRDSTYSVVGCKFDGSELTRLMEARVMKVQEPNKKMAYRICYPSKVAESLLLVGETRHRLHTTCYQHKTTIGCELLMCEILRAADPYITFTGSDGKEYSMSGCVDDMGAYEQLDDRVLYLIDYLRDPRLSKAKLCHRKLNERKFPRFVGKTNVNESDSGSTTPKELVTSFSQNTDVDPALIYVRIVKVHFGQGMKNPLELVWTFNHKLRNLDCVLTERILPKEILHTPVATEPKTFQSSLVFVYVDSSVEEKKYSEIEKAFVDWCANKKVTPHKRGPSQSSVTPDRKRFAESPTRGAAHVARNLTEGINGRNEI